MTFLLKEIYYGKLLTVNEGCMTKEYVTKTGQAYRVAGSRVSLDSVVTDFMNGLSPESIAENFPTLTLEQVFGAIAFYLGNRDEIDAYMKEGRAEFETQRLKSREENPLLYKKLQEAARKAQIES